MTIGGENLHHAQELQNRANNKGVKPKNYAPGDKVWLNNKYLKTKQKRKLEAKFFGPFWVLPFFEKQAYKLELPTKWKIYDVFHMSLLEQDNTRKERVGEKMTELDFEPGNSKEYKVEAIWDSTVYMRVLESHLPGALLLGNMEGLPWRRKH